MLPGLCSGSRLMPIQNYFPRAIWTSIRLLFNLTKRHPGPDNSCKLRYRVIKLSNPQLAEAAPTLGSTYSAITCIEKARRLLRSGLHASMRVCGFPRRQRLPHHQPARSIMLVAWLTPAITGRLRTFGRDYLQPNRRCTWFSSKPLMWRIHPSAEAGSVPASG